MINGTVSLLASEKENTKDYTKITDRGYANVVTSTHEEDVAYGLIYNLTPSDERSLDINEGVPQAYTKEVLEVDFWASKDGRTPVEMKRAAEKRNMLIYIDRKRTVDDEPRAEYIVRMNWGIADAMEAGIPSDYVTEVVRKFIPEGASQEVKELALKQASCFEDEA